MIVIQLSTAIFILVTLANRRAIPPIGPPDA